MPAFLRLEDGVAGRSNSLDTIGEGVRTTQSRRLVSAESVMLLLRLSFDEVAFLIGDQGSVRVELGTSFLRGGTESLRLKSLGVAGDSREDATP